MGWASGSRLMCDIIDSLHNEGIDKEIRKNVYANLIEAFSEFDCDTLDECTGIDKAFDEAYYAYYEIDPEEEQEDEDYEE